MRASDFIKEYGVGKITKQNATADVKPGDEFKNVKKLQLASANKAEKKKMNEEEKRLRQIEMFKHVG